MSQDEKPALNRAQRRKLDREVRRSIKTGVGVNITLAAHRVVKPNDDAPRTAATQPREERP